MPNWNESDYVERAKELARKHVTTNESINDLAEKVARDEALAPDEIRTLVRIANVHVFTEKHANMSGEDKNVQFAVGDPELVIHRIHESVAEPVQSANIFNDKLAHELPNFMQEVRLGRKFEEPTEKVAHDEEEAPRAPRRDMQALCMEKLAGDMHIEQIAQGQRWEDRLEKLAGLLRRAPGYGIQLEQFEKDAFAVYGEEVRPELMQVCVELRRAHELMDVEKVASLQGRHLTYDSQHLRLVKEAMDARAAYVKLKRASEWLQANTPKV